MKRFLAAVVMVAISCGVAWAQDGAGGSMAFEGSSESMKYRHLWMGYAALWLLIFGFVFRTWKRQQATGAELEDLKKRLDVLESAQPEGDA